MNMQRVKVGDVVLIHNDGPRIHWRLGVVHSLIQGNDGLFRAVNVKTNNQVTSRPISKLYPLEVSLPPDNQLEHNNVPDRTVSIEHDARDRPLRAAVKRARTRLLEWTTRLSHPRRMLRTR